MALGAHLASSAVNKGAIQGHPGPSRAVGSAHVASGSGSCACSSSAEANSRSTRSGGQSGWPAAERSRHTPVPAWQLRCTRDDVRWRARWQLRSGHRVRAPPRQSGGYRRCEQVWSPRPSPACTTTRRPGSGSDGLASPSSSLSRAVAERGAPPPSRSVGGTWGHQKESDGLRGTRKELPRGHQEAVGMSSKESP